ncbi:MAG: glycerol-3-phosphate dehydrogenase/oxidase [Verrucomicrobia bacterium]|nr:glycerol-3-phosphate dehydrogenase/oxidase [Verrucomicrobiota bacterium]
MNRDEMLKKVHAQHGPWDVIIIGGGATGLGAAVDSASRGYRTLLLEQHDFAKATSSRSTKLIHGGLRYLQQGNIGLVAESLRERGLLCENAPHLVSHLSFLVPNYHWWEGPFYGIGLKLYDLLAGKLGLEPSKHLSRQQTIRALPTLEREGLRGGVIYYDGQFDDARLAIALARTAADHGAVLLNYAKVTSLIKKRGQICGVKVTDEEHKHSFTVHGKVVINACGIFSDHVREMDDTKSKPIIAGSQGVHLVLPRSFMPGKTAILVPHTEDGRVIFLVPWHGRILVGTTDTPVTRLTLEPQAQKKEIDFLLRHAARYLTKDPKPSDILSVFCGIRPLVHKEHAKSTASLARDHTILVSRSNLITITGGKWTTYRQMAEDVIDKAIVTGKLPQRCCITKNLRLHTDPPLKSSKRLHPHLPYHLADVMRAIDEEMARTVEDILARRTRSLLLNAKASLKVAPKVAHLLAIALGKSAAWERKQVTAYEQVAKHYTLSDTPR